MGAQEASQFWEKRLRGLGYSVLTLEREAGPQAMGRVELVEVRFKLDADGGTSCLAVVKGVRDGQGLVAFVGALDLSTCMLSLGKAVSTDSLRWREDRPWSG